MSLSAKNISMQYFVIRICIGLDHPDSKQEGDSSNGQSRLCPRKPSRLSVIEDDPDNILPIGGDDSSDESRDQDQNSERRTVRMTKESDDHTG